MKEKLEQIREEALRQIGEAGTPEALNEVRVAFLGKKGSLTTVLKSMKDVAPEERPKVGQLVNEARAEIESALESAKLKMERAIMEKRLEAGVIDVRRRIPWGTGIPIRLSWKKWRESLSVWVMRLWKARRWKEIIIISKP